MDRRLTPRGEERRRQLMEFAVARFAEKGYHSTSVAEIVQGLGVGKGVFYWYFSSKEELFREIMRESQLELRRRQQASISDEPDPVKRIELGIRASAAWLRDRRDLFTLVQFAITEERFAGFVRRGQQVVVADVVRHVKDGIVEGRIRDSDPEIIAHAIIGVLNQLSRVFVLERDGSGDEIADAAVAFCMHGLLGCEDG